MLSFTWPSLQCDGLMILTDMLCLSTSGSSSGCLYGFHVAACVYYELNPDPCSLIQLSF